MKKGVLVAFGELFLKSKGVKDLFQRKLINNLRFFLEKENVEFKIKSLRERIFINTDGVKKTEKIVKRTFGISWLAESYIFSDFEELLGHVNKNYPKWIKKNESFAIRMKKDRKLIDKLAEKIDRKVNLDKPEKELFIEKRDNNWFLYFKKKKGAGGLPLGSSGKVLSLISGGIDSVPASYLIAKRGADNIWVHFHSFPVSSKKSIEKVKELAVVFSRYNPKLKVYFVPFKDIQLEIKTKTPANLRVLLYRRFMLKIAEKIAKKEDCKAIVTGESLGQVSSQTLSNMKITQKGVNLPILRPLIGLDKEEIIALAKDIKVFDISIKPQEDCCTLFIPKGQTAEGDLKEVKKYEKQLDLQKLVKNAIKTKSDCYF